MTSDQSPPVPPQGGERQQPCEFPVGEFVFGTTRCAVLGDKVVEDAEGALGFVCDHHFKLITEARDAV